MASLNYLLLKSFNCQYETRLSFISIKFSYKMLMQRISYLRSVMNHHPRQYDYTTMNMFHFSQCAVSYQSIAAKYLDGIT